MLNKTGNVVILRMNFLHQPFSNAEGAAGDALSRRPERLHEGDVRHSEMVQTCPLDVRQRHADVE